MRILKQVLTITDINTYALPGTKIEPLCVKDQNGNLVLYFETNATADEIVDRSPLTPITVAIAGTGHDRNDLDGFKYLGTAMMSYGLVWHCYVKQELSYDM